MKKLFYVDVRESYRKTVEVAAEDVDWLEEEVGQMEENGEIVWDRGADFEKWEIVDYNRTNVSAQDIKDVANWARDVVRITAMVDSDWVLNEMTRDDCMEWLESLRDAGITIHRMATSEDLWKAVLKERGEE